jgi:hypothetical protein
LLISTALAATRPFGILRFPFVLAVKHSVVGAVRINGNQTPGT